LRIVRESAPKFRLTLVNSVNPYRIEGQKTGAFELCDALGRAPDVLAIPGGNAGHIPAYWRGLVQSHPGGRSAARAKLWGCPAGRDPRGVRADGPRAQTSRIGAAHRAPARGRPGDAGGAGAGRGRGAGGPMIRVRVPATAANLGPGFDALGLALRLYNTLTLEP